MEMEINGDGAWSWRWRQYLMMAECKCEVAATSEREGRAMDPGFMRASPNGAAFHIPQIELLWHAACVP